mgnify:CR=1 FL=1
MKKDSRYDFRVNKELKDKFKMYCKVMNISPSDVLSEVMVDFTNNVDKIIEMKSIEELQAMIQGKFEQVQEELDSLKAEKK